MTEDAVLGKHCECGDVVLEIPSPVRSLYVTVPYMLMMGMQRAFVCITVVEVAFARQRPLLACLQNFRRVRQRQKRDTMRISFVADARLGSGGGSQNLGQSQHASQGLQSARSFSALGVGTIVLDTLYLGA